MRTSWPQRLLLLLVGLVGGLAVLELGLRASAWTFLWRQAQVAHQAAARPDAVRILCVGESTTALGGADAYPVQLQRVLDRRPAPAVPVSVINVGVPAIGSDYILEHLPGWLDEYRPHVVVAMMGVNDGTDEEKPSALRAALESLRVVKVAQQFVMSRWVGGFPWLREDFTATVKALRAGDRDAASAAVQRGLAADARDLQFLAVRVALAPPPERPAAVDAARAAAAGSPLGHATLMVAYVALEQFDLAHEEDGWLRQHAGAAQGIWLTSQYVIQPLIDQMLRERRVDAAAAALELVGSFPPPRDLPGYEHRMAQLARARGDQAEYERRLNALAVRHAWELSATTNANYRRPRDLLRARGIRLVAVQYALRPLPPLQQTLEYAPDVVFVDTEAPFRDAMAASSYEALFTDAFAGDFGHCTARGNELLATTIATALERQVLPNVRPDPPRGAAGS